MHQTLTAHMVVKNEDKWIWFSIMSIIDKVDQLIIFDNGSTDRTVSIIQEIIKDKGYAEKIIFEVRKDIDIVEFWKLRQEQIERTKTDYMMVVDGDEIWWESSLIELRDILDREKPELVTTHFVNCGGDIYHYRDSSREHYQIDGIEGAYTNRVFSMHIEGLHCGGGYGEEGYRDKDNLDIQNHGRKNVFMKRPYLHMSVLDRSSIARSDLSVSSRKRKLLLQGTYDYTFPENFHYPEALYLDRPTFVDSPWKKNRNILRKITQLLHDIRFGIDKVAKRARFGEEFL